MHPLGGSATSLRTTDASTLWPIAQTPWKLRTIRSRSPAQESDSLVDHRLARAADGVVVERAAIDVRALDEQVRERTGRESLRDSALQR